MQYLYTMEIKISTQQILKILHVISWVIFIGLCVETGGVIFNMIFTRFVNPEAAKQFWEGIDLSSLYNFDTGHFLVQTTFMSIVLIMETIMFYLIVKILYDKKLNLLQPFNKEVGKFISNLSYLTLGVGLFSYTGTRYASWLMKQGVNMPEVNQLKLGGADVWLFTCVILFVIAHIFKRGIELQEENDLTI